MEVSDTHLSPALEELREIERRRYKLDDEAPSGVSNYQGKPIGYKRKDGYWVLSYGGKQLLAHRVVWVLTHGTIPNDLVIDHVDRNPSNNNVKNLRVVTQQENLMNVGVRSHCSSGEKYINLDKRTGNYTVRIHRKAYGTYRSLDDAVNVRDAVLNAGM